MLTADRSSALRTAGPFAVHGSEPRTSVALAGADRTKLLNNLCTNDVARLPVGVGCEAFLCNAKGGVLFYVVIWNLGDELWIESEPGYGPALVKHLDRYIIREKAAPIDRTSNTVQRTLIGSQSVQRIAEAFGAAAVPAESMKLAKVESSTHPVTVRRRDFGDAPIYVMAYPNEISAVCDSRLGWDSLPTASAEELAALAILAGVPALGAEVQEGNLPQEIDRVSQSISFTKGCYIGQETVARLDAYGHVNKILRGVVVPGVHEKLVGAKIVYENKEIGVVHRAAAFAAPAGPEMRFMAILKSAASKPGAIVTVDANGALAPGKVCELPFAKF